jgi:tripartite-type tricarboxylate transporter receptor subunit TctC
VVGLPDVKERLFNAGFEIVTSTPEQFAAFTRDEIQKWRKIVKAAGLKVD